MSKRLAGKRALVTGAASGIGRAANAGQVPAGDVEEFAIADLTRPT